MASEDSDQFRSGLVAIHGLRDLDDLEQTSRLEVPAGGDELHAFGERLEVATLRRQQRIRAEERDDRFHQIRASVDAILQEILAMVVAPSVSNNPPDPEEARKSLEAGNARFTLRDCKAMGRLIAGSVAVSARSVWLPNEADREASFSVYKTNNPASSGQSFLLVFRTFRVVTAHSSKLRRVPDGYTGFSSI